MSICGIFFFFINSDYIISAKPADNKHKHKSYDFGVHMQYFKMPWI